MSSEALFEVTDLEVAVHLQNLTSPVVVDKVSFSLAAGESLYLMTDGPTEAVCRDGNAFGATGVMASARRHGGDLDRVVDEIRYCAADTDGLDDLSILRIDGGDDRAA